MSATSGYRGPNRGRLNRPNVISCASKSRPNLQHEGHEMKLKPAGKLAILLIVAGVAYGGYRVWSSRGASIMEAIAPSGKESGSVNPGKIDLPEGNSGVSSTSSGGSVTLPGTNAG